MSSKKNITVIISGGREYGRKKYFFSVLDGVHKKYGIALVKHGACNAKTIVGFEYKGMTGADALAQAWADERGVPVKPFPADWKNLSKAAGPIRNREMAASGADLCLLFPGESGTRDMCRTADEFSIPVAFLDLSEF